MGREYSLDYLKFFAMFFVVCIHTHPFKETDSLWVDGNIINFIIDTFARFAVPFFFITSGYLFTKKITNVANPPQYYKRYISKLLKLYISWSFFYLLYDIVTISLESGIKNIPVGKSLSDYFLSVWSLKAILYYSVGGGIPSGYQMWYLIALVWSITLLYLFSKINKINLLLIISLILNLVGLFGQSYSSFFELPIKTRDALFYGLIYTSLGAFFALNFDTIRSRLKFSSKVYFFLFVTFSILQLLERYYTNQILGGNSGDYFVATLFLTSFLFLFCLNSPTLGKNSLITKIGKDSVGVYVTHLFFLVSINKIINFLDVEAIMNTIAFQILLTPVVFLVSYFAYTSLLSVKKTFSFKKRESVGM